VGGLLISGLRKIREFPSMVNTTKDLLNTKNFTSVKKKNIVAADIL
jgi:hypothetical protein